MFGYKTIKFYLITPFRIKHLFNILLIDDLLKDTSDINTTK